MRQSRYKVITAAQSLQSSYNTAWIDIQAGANASTIRIILHHPCIITLLQSHNHLLNPRQTPFPDHEEIRSCRRLRRIGVIITTPATHLAQTAHVSFHLICAPWRFSSISCRRMTNPYTSSYLSRYHLNTDLISTSSANRDTPASTCSAAVAFSWLRAYIWRALEAKFHQWRIYTKCVCDNQQDYRGTC